MWSLVVGVFLTSATTSAFYWPPHRVPSAGDDTIQVSIVLSSDYQTESSFPAALKRSGPAILLGFEHAEKRGLFADGVYFNVTFRESGCNSTYGLKSFLDAYIDKVDVLFGPSCDYSLGKSSLCISLVKVQVSRQ